jgi:hypothetical protein
VSEQISWRISPFPQEIEARQRQRARLAERTRLVVLDEFRKSAETSDEDASFEAALDAYCGRHPEVPRHVALHAVAEILAEAGLG